MTIWLALAATGLAVVLFWRQSAGREGEVPPGWRMTAQRLGLGLLQRPLRIEGELEGCRVQVKLQGRPRSWTRFEVLSPFGPTGVRFLGPTRDGGGVEVGDSAFDGSVDVIGDAARAVALCDAHLRRRLERLSWGTRFEIVDGRVSVKMAGVATSSAVLEQTIEELVIVAQALDLETRSVTARLLERLEDDPQPAVRRRAWRLLEEGGAQVDDARAVALNDADPELRWMATQALPIEEAREHLLALAMDSVAVAEIRCTALERLRAEVEPEALAPVVDAVVGHAPSGVSRLAFAVALEIEHDPDLEALLKWAHLVEDDAGEQLAGLLERADDPAAEHALLGLLGRDALETRLAAARALGSVGSEACLQRLETIATELTAAPELRTATRLAAEAVAERAAAE